MFAHETLDVYQVSLKFVKWSYGLSKDLRGMDRHARDQLLRASQSIPLNIAEGNGKRPSPDRRRFLQIAYGSGLECAAVLDVLVACDVVSESEIRPGKALLNRIVAMLVRLITPLESVCEEESALYGAPCESRNLTA